MEPTVQMEHVSENEDQGDQAAGPLQRVSPVASVVVAAGVRQAATDDHDPHDGMEDDREEDERPLDDRQHRPEAVNHVDRPLEIRGACQQAAIRNQVYHHVRPDRNKSAERKQAANEEFVASDERLRRG